MSRPNFRSSRAPRSYVRINGRIRAREVRVIDVDGRQLGVKSLGEALKLARALSVDLVEVAAQASPPVCRLVNYGKYQYEQAKRKKEAKKHQHANRVKEVQLTATIDPHDFDTKVNHAVEFLCEDMKVKASLRFRGREMAHKEFGFQVVQRFLKAVSPYGNPDAPPRLAGRNLNVMVSPLPRNKRAPNPSASSSAKEQDSAGTDHNEERSDPHPPESQPQSRGTGEDDGSFSNSPFANLDSELKGS